MGWRAALISALAAAATPAAAFDSFAQALNADGHPTGTDGLMLPALFGAHIPLNANFDRALVRASPESACTPLTNSVDEVRDAVVLVTLGGSCDTDTAARHANAKYAAAVLFVGAGPTGISRVMLGWEAKDDTPLDIPRMLVDSAFAAGSLATASRVRLRLEAIPLVPGTMVRAHLDADRDRYYSYELPEDGPLEVVVFSYAGDADVYVNRGDSLDAVALPSSSGLGNDYGSAQPGDDLVSVLDAPAGTYLVLVNAYGAAADYNIQLSAHGSEMELSAGAPVRLAAGADMAKHFVHRVEGAFPSHVRFHLTALTGSADMWVCTANPGQHPETASACRWSSVSALAPVVEVGSGEVSCSSGCELHAVVRSSAGQVQFSVVVSRGDEPIRLVDGSPQAGLLTMAHHTNKYTLHTGPSAGRVEVTASPSSGDMEAVARDPNSGRTWTLSRGTGYTLQTDEVCADCDIEVDAKAVRGDDGSYDVCAYTITVATTRGIVTLEDGVPLSETVGDGELEYFRVRVENPQSDVTIVVTPLSGDPDLYVSTRHSRPNATHHERSSQSTDRDQVFLGHEHQIMQTCAARADGCVVYAAVAGFGQSTFSIMATISVPVSGLTIDAPARLAGAVDFSRAVFGAPLPFEGVSTPLRRTTPGDACGPITESLMGKVALVDRGGCDFADKVSNAQLRNASAVIVVNNDPGEPVRMGVRDGFNASRIRVPAVMVRQANGTALKSALAAGEEVRVTLQQPGDRPRTLLGGMPQQGHVERNQIVFYSFALGEGEDAASGWTVTVTPSVGDPDVLVAADGLPPTQTHYGWKADASGADSVSVRPSDAGFCTGCTYFIGVSGFTACDYSIVARVSSGSSTLQLGVPRASRIDAGGWEYFVLHLGRRDAPLRISVTPITGDPDLYVSETVEEPEESTATWQATEWGRDSIVIEPSDLPEEDDTLYIGVSAFTDTSFTITAALVTDEGPMLVDGQPQAVTLQDGEWSYFRVTVGAGLRELTLTVTPTSGDPDIYVTADGKVPTDTVYDFASNGPGEDVLVIAGSDAAACSDCTYRVGVLAYLEAAFTITATADYSSAAGGGEEVPEGETAEPAAPVTLLQEGQPVQGHVDEGEYAYYRLPVDRTDMAVNVTVTPFYGDPDIYASFTAQHPTAATADFSATALGGDSLSVSHFAAEFCTTRPCSLFIGVHGASEARFSVVARQHNESMISLMDGVPQHAELGAGSWAYFRFSLGPYATSLDLSVTPSFGDPDMYVRVGTDFVPSEADHDWSSVAPGADEIAISSEDVHWRAPPVTFTIGVKAWSASAFSITATSSEGLVLLEDGSPVSGSVAPGAYSYYRLFVGGTGQDVEVVVTPIGGNPDIFLSVVDMRPNATRHQLASTSDERDVVLLRHDAPELAACTASDARCSVYVSVRATGDARALFQMSASLHDVNSGFEVTEPASLAGQYESRRAIFGPPLPIRSAGPMAVVAVDPPDACSPLSGGTLSGSIALVSRGECFFTDKVKHAQQRGAAAVIVVNTDDTLLMMASPSLAEAALVTIPSVLVALPLGERIREALPGVKVTLQQPGDRPRMLVDGRPQYGHVLRWGLVYYKFTVGDAHHDVTFTLAPEAGAADLFVRRADDGLPPTQSFYDLASAQPGAAPDSITIRSGSEWSCERCTYLLGVAGLQPTNYTVTASTSQAIVSLQAGVPVTEHLETGSSEYFRVDVTNASNKLRVLITPLTGDPDVYVSRTAHRPSADNCTWASTNFGADAVTVLPSDPDFRVGPYFIGVTAFVNTTFTITALVETDECVELRDGQPQHVDLESDDFQCLSVAVGVDVASLTITVTPLSGDPDLYVSAGTHPTRTSHGWASRHDGTDEVTIDTAGAGACVACTYFVGVHAFTETSFNIQATSSTGGNHTDDSVTGHRVLTDAVPTTTTITNETTVFFSYFVEDDTTEVDVRASKLSGGRVTMYASFTRPYPTDDASSDFKATMAAFSSNSGIAIPADHEARCSAGVSGAPCVLYVGVRAVESASTVSILASQRDNAVITLVDGSPQNDYAVARVYRYYSVSVPANASEVAISVTPTYGDPDLLMSAGRAARPTLLNHTWASLSGGADTLRVAKSDPHWCAPCVLVVGVYAFRQSEYSIVARSSRGTLPPSVMLQDGTPFEDAIGVDENATDNRFYRFGITDAFASVLITVTPLTGDPDLYASFEDTRPTSHSSGRVFQATGLSEEQLQVSHFDPKWACEPDALPCMLYIGVHAYAGAASYTIVVRQAEDTAVTLADGVPQHGSSAESRWHYFTFNVGDAAQHVTFNLLPSFGDPDMYVARGGFPSRAEFDFSSQGAGGDRVTITQADEEWCDHCSWHVGIYAFSETNYTLVASTGTSLIHLEDGVPHMESVAAGAYDYFRVRVEDPHSDLSLVVTSVSGNPDLYVSHLHTRPNLTHYEFLANTTHKDTVYVSHASDAMRDCTAPGDARPCFFYVGVHGATNATFTLTASVSIASSGFRVDAPPRLVGGMVFSNAVFGPPFPFEGTPRELVAVEPREACAPITTPSLNDKVVLVDRGDCYFTAKVRNAQSRGAYAVVVANDQSGLPVAMGVPSSEAAADLHIGAVMISKADGAALRAALADGEQVMVTLQQPGDRPTSLSDGLPQFGSVAHGSFKFYRFRVGAAHRDVTFTITPTLGDPDLYITASATPPTQTHYDREASHVGGDSVTFHPGDDDFCTDCVYTVGVYGWTNAEFMITAATSLATVTLQVGVPLTEHLLAGEWEYFRVFASEGDEELAITLTPLSGDPDMYVSTEVRAPNETHHTWASTRLGDDTVVISEDDPNFVAGAYYVGVTAFSNTSFTISASTRGQVLLVPGRPQRMRLGADSWQQFTFSAPVNASGLTFTVTPAFGDPDLYVTADGTTPDAQHYDWKAARSGGDTLSVTTSDPHWCPPPCQYNVGVYAWAASNFSVVAVVERDGEARCGASAMDLEGGTVVYAAVGANKTKCFRLAVDAPDLPLTLAVTPFSGRVRVTAGFGRRGEDARRGVQAMTVSGSTGGSLTLQPACEQGGGESASFGACALHIKVACLDDTDSTVSLAAFQTSTAGAISLVPGRPQYGALPAGGWTYFTFVASDAQSPSARVPLTLSLMPVFGDPNMYIRNDGVTPSLTSHQWESSAAGGDHLLIAADDANVCSGACRYTIAVHAASATNFSLTAYAHGDVVTLQEGIPLTAVVRTDCARFALHSTPGQSSLLLSLTALSGAPVAFVGDEPRPGAAKHLPGGRLDSSPVDSELSVDLTSVTSEHLFVSVCVGVDGMSSRFVLLARLHASTPALLLDGRPFTSRVADGGIAQFRFAVGPHAERAQVTVSPRSGGVALLLSPRGAGHDGAGSGSGAAAFDLAPWRSDVPGVNTILARASDPGWCRECEYAVGIMGQPAANFTVLVTLERGYTLRDGEPQTAQLVHYDSAASERSAYFAYSVDQEMGFSIIVTVFMGSPQVFVSAVESHPSAASFQWVPATSDAEGAGGVREVRILPDDPNFCSGCTYYVGVHSFAENCTVAVTATSDALRTISLVNGLPLKQSLVGGEYRYFEIALADGAGDLTVAIQPEAGDSDVDIFVTADGSQPSSTQYQWKSDARHDSEDQVTVRAQDSAYCSACTYRVAVFATHTSTVTIVATTSTGTTLLPLGLPSEQRVPVGATVYFNAVLNPEGDPADVTVVPLRAPIHMALSTLTSQPSDDFHKALVDAPLGEPTRFQLDRAKLRQWCPTEVQMNGMCSLYIAVSTTAADEASFSISVNQGSGGVLIPGLPQLSSADPARPRLFTLSVDGTEARDITISVTMQLDSLDGGSAGGLQVLVSNSDHATDDVGWRAHADSSLGGTASVFIAHDDEGACQGCTYHVTVVSLETPCDFTIIASSARGHTLLTHNALVQSEVGEGQMALFKTYASRDSGESLVVTLTPCAGNPDLFLSDVIMRPGPPDDYTFASDRSDGVDQIIIPAATLDKLGDTLFLSVLGKTSAVFTIGVSPAAEPEPPLAPPEGGEAVEVSAESRRGVIVSWLAAHARSDDMEGEESSLDPGEVTYSVQLAPVDPDARRAPALFTQCGIQLGATAVANRTGLDADAEGRISAFVEGLDAETEYKVTVRATTIRAGRPLIYRPAAFMTPPRREPMSAGAVVAIILGLLLACLLAGLAAIIVRRRKQLRDLSLIRNDQAAVDAGGSAGPGGGYDSFVPSPLFGTPGTEGGGGNDLRPLFAPPSASTRDAAAGIGASAGAPLGMLAAAEYAHPGPLHAPTGTSAANPWGPAAGVEPSEPAATQGDPLGSTAGSSQAPAHPLAEPAAEIPQPAAAAAATMDSSSEESDDDGDSDDDARANNDSQALVPGR